MWRCVEKTPNLSCWQTQMSIAQDWDDPLDGQPFALCVVNTCQNVSDGQISRWCAQWVAAGAAALMYVGVDGEYWLYTYERYALQAEREVVSVWRDVDANTAHTEFCQYWHERFQQLLIVTLY